LRWLAVVSLTAHSEGFNGISVGSDAVYAVGKAAEYGVGDVAEESFGYGLISKLGLDDGHVIANFTLGDDHYKSGFNAAILTTGGLLTAGFTNEVYTHQGDFQAWIATVNVDTTGVGQSREPTTALNVVGSVDRGAARPVREHRYLSMSTD
jgi:hypothetical protein